MKVDLGPANRRDVTYIVGNMRPDDRAEVFCQFPRNANADYVAASVVTAGSSFIAYVNDFPAAVFGFAPMVPAGNVLSAWAFGTKRLPLAIRTITRFVRRELVPRWIEDGVTRIEARTLISHRSAHRWLEATGAFREATIPYWGLDGQTFLLYVWRIDRFDKPDASGWVTLRRFIKE